MPFGRHSGLSRTPEAASVTSCLFSTYLDLRKTTHSSSAACEKYSSDGVSSVPGCVRAGSTSDSVPPPFMYMSIPEGRAECAGIWLGILRLIDRRQRIRSSEI